MRRGRGLFAACFALALGFGIACGSFDASDQPAAANDGGTDSTTTTDGPTTDAPSSDALPDVDGGPSCEVLSGTVFTSAKANVLALGADSAHVYWSDSGGVWRLALSGAGAAERVGDEAASHIVVGTSFVAWRAQNGSIRAKSTLDIDADASSPSPTNNTSGLAPRTGDAFLVRRPDLVMSCTTADCGQTLDRPGVRGVAAAGGGYDFLATSGAGIGVFHCASGCTVSDAGVLLANASASSTEVTNDAESIFWTDLAQGSVRKVGRLGGLSVDLITGLVEPRRLFIDANERIVVVTYANGIFRGPKTGCVLPPATSTAVVAASAVSATTVWYAEGTAIKRVDP